MPLTRYQIRNECSLADPELYRAADRDDPEALLEGLAMAGLVGVLRQLGDLAEFAAEIFHDLHEEVMATTARGHGLMVRVQQLEAEFPSIEKAFLSQTNHSLFFSNSGVDWHPNLRTEQNLITRGDLPRCVMDSYEECRGPPRLFLLDKFDVSGAGACLKRYTDPSFFKIEAASSGRATVEVQREREKKSRKVKKKGSRWRNGGTPEIAPTSHAKLHQLFLEERVENGYTDPARLVKLKRRQLNGSPLNLKSGKSYMERFLQTPSPERKTVCEISISPQPLTLTSDNSSTSELKILEINTVSTVKKSSQGKDSTAISPNAQGVLLKPSVDKLNGEVIDREIVKVPEPTADGETHKIPFNPHKTMAEKKIVIDGKGKTEGSSDGDHSEDLTSEVDNYVDALTTMESEMETDNEYRLENKLGFLHVEKHWTDSGANEEQMEVPAQFLDSQSIVNTSTTDERDRLFQKGRSSSSYSDTISTSADNAPSDGEGAAKLFYSSSSQLSVDKEVLGSDFHKLASVSGRVIDKNSIPDLEEESYGSCHTNSNPTLLPVDPGASSQVVSPVASELDETPSDCVKLGTEKLSTGEIGTNLADSSAVISDVNSGKAIFTNSAESHPENEFDGGDSSVSSDTLPHFSNIQDLAPEEKCCGSYAGAVLQTDYVDKKYSENFVNGKIGSAQPIISPMQEHFPCTARPEVEDCSGLSLLGDGSDVVKPDDLVPNVNDLFPAAEINSGKITHMGTEVDDSIPATEEGPIVDDAIPAAKRNSENVTPTDTEVDNADDAIPVAELNSKSIVPMGTEVDDTIPDTEDFSEVDDAIPAAEVNLENTTPMGTEFDDIIQATEEFSEVDDAIPASEFNSENITPMDTEVDDSIPALEVSSENKTPTAGTSQTCSLKAQKFSGTRHDVPQVGLDAAYIVVFNSEHKTNSEEVSSVAYDEELRGFLCKDDAAEVDAVPLEFPSSYLDNLGLDNQVGMDYIETETVHKEDAAGSYAVNADDDVNGFVCLSSILICSPSGNLTDFLESPSGDSDQPQEGLEFNQAISSEYHIEPEAEKEMNQLEVAPADLDSVPFKSVSYGYSSQEIFDDVQDSSLSEPNKNSLLVDDVTTAPLSSELSDIELEIKSCQHSYLVENSKDVVSSPICYFPEPGTPLEQSLEFLALRVERLQADEASSKLSNLQSEQVQCAYYKDQERCLQASSESCPVDFLSEPSSSDFLLHSSSQELDSTKQAMDPLDSVLPSFRLLPEATQVSLEEMPPLPPLPPMQWRIGKFQHAPPSSQRELVENSQASFPTISPFAADSNTQLGLTALERGIAQPGNPFLPLTFVEEKSQHVPEQFVDNLVQPSPFTLQLPTVVSDANSRHNRIALEGTQALNPFLMLPAVSNGKPEYDLLSLEESVECATSRNDLVSSRGEPIQPLNQLAPEAGLEGDALQHIPQNSGECENPSDTSMPPPTKVEEQPQVVDPALEAGTTELLNSCAQHGLSCSEEETAWPSNAFALAPTFEVGNANGNPTAKLPRPRSPLIDAVAAQGRSTLRKVSEQVRPEIQLKVDERDSLLEQIRTKSFNLKPALVVRPNIQGPKTNLKLTAILEKANAIRQATAGSDEDDDTDNWSDS